MVAKLDEWGKPAWIALMILGFVVWWPIGLATLAFIIGSGRMSCWKGGGMSRWHAVPDQMRQPERGGRRRARAATARLTSIARTPCSASKRSSASSTTSWLACGWRRTRPSSISSWPNVAPAPGRRRPDLAAELNLLRHRRRSGRPPPVGGPICIAGAATGVRGFGQIDAVACFCP
jgi:hypothetical protein